MSTEKEQDKGPVLGQRHLQSFLLFLGIVANYVTKYNASVAVVAMTNADTTNPDFDEYDWNEKQKSYILSSFFWGYLISQFPGGYICRRYGVKRTLFLATFLSSIVGIAVPFCVPWGGWQIYCVIRVLQGTFQGPLLACVQAHLAVWCPIMERNRLGGFANTGIECGTLLSMYLSGAVAASSMGWPGISYVSAAVGLAWCVIWLIWSADSPTKSKYISSSECAYIVSSKYGQTGLVDVVPARKIPIPWRAMFTSTAFLAVLVARGGEAWGFSTMQAEMPSYMNGVLNLEMDQNAIFSALPYLSMWVMAIVFLILADIFLNQKIMSLNAIRKSFNSIAFWIPMLGLIGVGFLDESQKTLAIVLMVVNVGANAGNTIGCLLNPIDLSPNHTIVIMSVVNCVSGVVTLITPLLVGVIVTDVHDRTQWQIVFAIAAGVFGLSNLIYILIGSTNLQPWDSENFLLENKNSLESKSNSNTNTNTIEKDSCKDHVGDSK